MKLSLLLTRSDVEPVQEPHSTVLDRLDRIRAILAPTGLTPTPVVYELLWNYLEDNDHELSRALDFALAMKTLDARMAATLHRTHCVKWHDD